MTKQYNLKDDKRDIQRSGQWIYYKCDKCQSPWSEKLKDVRSIENRIADLEHRGFVCATCKMMESAKHEEN